MYKRSASGIYSDLSTNHPHPDIFNDYSRTSRLPAQQASIGRQSNTMALTTSQGGGGDRIRQLLGHLVRNTGEGSSLPWPPTHTPTAILPPISQLLQSIKFPYETLENVDPHHPCSQHIPCHLSPRSSKPVRSDTDASGAHGICEEEVATLLLSLSKYRRW